MALKAVQAHLNNEINNRNRLLAGIYALSDSIIKDLTDRQIALARLAEDDPTLTEEEKVIRSEAKTLIRVSGFLLRAASELGGITKLVTPLHQAEEHVGKTVNGWVIKRVAYEVMKDSGRIVYFEASCPKCKRNTILRASAIFSGQQHCGNHQRRSER
jgi:formyltetrahydrofolate synthetase